jgi:hypothetical protein
MIVILVKLMVVLVNLTTLQKEKNGKYFVKMPNLLQYIARVFII